MEEGIEARHVFIDGLNSGLINKAIHGGAERQKCCHIKKKWSNLKKGEKELH